MNARFHAVLPEGKPFLIKGNVKGVKNEREAVKKCGYAVPGGTVFVQLIVPKARVKTFEINKLGRAREKHVCYGMRYLD